MKKLMALIMTIVLLGGTAVMATGCGSSSDESSDGGNQTLRFYNWGEYVSQDVIRDFEKEFDCTVICDYFDSNEAMYNKVKNGDKYDVIIPSDYMIERMIREDMLLKLDQSKIPNISKLANGVKGLAFDADNSYSIPYFWGNVGILYNPDEVSKEDVESEGWEVLRNEKYKGKLYMYDSERDSFMVALKALGYSMNTENEAEINEAYQWLKTLNDTMEPVYVTDEVIDNMITGNKDLAVVYSGDGAYITDENEDLVYYTPAEGTNIWCDAMVIPKTSENQELAYKFINYMLDNEIGTSNTEEVGYASSNQEVLDEMTAEGGTFAENSAYLPRENYEKDEVFHDNETIRKMLSDLWIKVKASQ